MKKPRLTRLSHLAIDDRLHLNERKLLIRGKHNHSYGERGMEACSRSGAIWGGGKVRKACQSGFTHLAIIAAVVVVAAIATAGYLVVKNGNKVSQNSSTATSTSPSATTTSESKDETATKAAAKDHFALVYQKKFNEAYQSSCQGFKDKTSYTVFQTSLERGNLYTADLSAIEYTSVDVRDNQAQLSGLVGPLMPNSSLKVALLKESGQWCVFGYKVE